MRWRRSRSGFAPLKAAALQQAMSRGGGDKGQRPSHVVLGGWAPKIAKDIEKHANDWLHSLDLEEMGQTKRPYSPRPLGAIAKAKFSPDLLQRVAFRWQAAIDAKAGADAEPRQGPGTRRSEPRDTHSCTTTHDGMGPDVVLSDSAMSLCKPPTG